MVSSKGNSCAQIEFFYSCVVAAYRYLCLSPTSYVYIFLARTPKHTLSLKTQVVALF